MIHRRQKTAHFLIAIGCLIWILVDFPVRSVTLGQDQKPVVMASKDRKWYLNYLDALDFIESGQHQAAAQYLETTISQKTQPKKSVKMYGSIRRSYIPYYFLGVAQFNLGKYELAENNFRKSRQFGAVLKLPEGQELSGYIQKIEIKLAELKKSLTEPVVNKDYDNALDFFTAKQYAAARPLLEKVRSEGGAFAEKAANLLLKIDEAEARQRKLHQLQQDAIRLAGQADDAFRQGRWQDALDLYNQVSAKKPDFPGLIGKITKTNNALRLSRELDKARQLAAKDPSEAEEILEKIQQEDPNFPGVPELVRLVAEEKRKKEQADKKAALANYLSEGVRAFESGQLDRAGRRFRDALTLGPGAEKEQQIRDYLHRIESQQNQLRQLRELLNQGQQALRNDDRDTARKAFEDVLALEPGHAKAREYLDLMDRMAGGDISQEAEKLLKGGVRKFLLGSYSDAASDIKTYLTLSKEKEQLAVFFLGAAQVSQYFVVQMENRQLLDEGHKNMLTARLSDSFILSNRLRSLLSPRILEVYEKDHLDNQ